MEIIHAGKLKSTMNFYSKKFVLSNSIVKMGGNF